MAGVVFVLDGVLIGAGDGRYLAWAGWPSWPCSPRSRCRRGRSGARAGLAVGGVRGLFMGGRAVVLLHRARGDAWMVTGA